LYYRTPFIEQLTFFDKRLLQHDSIQTEFITYDRKSLVVDFFSHWRIFDPLKFLRTVGNEIGARARLDDIIRSELRLNLGRKKLKEIVATGSSALMARVTKESDRKARRYGIQIVDVRLKRVDLPQENRNAIFDRMKAERRQVESRYRFGGRREARRIRSKSERERDAILAEASAKAEPLYRRALAIREKALGPGHLDFGRALTSLSAVLLSLGKYADAEPFLRRALAIREKALGPERPDVARILKNLGRVYRAQKRYGEAETALRRALTIFEEKLKPDHPIIAGTLNDLAGLYQMLGKWKQAALLRGRARAVRPAPWASARPSTIKEPSPGPLAEAKRLDAQVSQLYQARRYAEALSPAQRSLSIREKFLGPEDPRVADSLKTLARLYKDQRQFEKAESHYKRALAIREKKLGPNHPDVAAALYEMAPVYFSQRKFTEALLLLERALGILEKNLGPDHIRIVRLLNRLAFAYQAAGKWGEATPAREKARAMRKRLAGGR
jgi:regulator of protease activity HflC (stomatin/prohibitin superfamily)